MGSEKIYVRTSEVCQFDYQPDCFKGICFLLPLLFRIRENCTFNSYITNLQSLLSGTGSEGLWKYRQCFLGLSGSCRFLISILQVLHFSLPHMIIREPFENLMKGSRIITKI